MTKAWRLIYSANLPNASLQNARGCPALADPEETGTCDKQLSCSQGPGVLGPRGEMDRWWHMIHEGR